MFLLKVGHEEGPVLNPNSAEYRIATSLGMPNVTPIFVEPHEPYGPFGAKEVGEGAIMPAIPARGPGAA